MSLTLKGLHHVSAITAKAPENYKFYTEVLGLRLIKKQSTRMISPSITCSTAMKPAIRAQS